MTEENSYAVRNEGGVDALLGALHLHRDNSRVTCFSFEKVPLLRSNADLSALLSSCGSPMVPSSLSSQSLCDSKTLRYASDSAWRTIASQQPTGTGIIMIV